MALVRDHALRRREGLASNSLSMMRTGSTDGVEHLPPLPCPTRGCREVFGPTSQDALDLHVLTAHPRSRHADDVRGYYLPNHPEVEEAV